MTEESNSDIYVQYIEGYSWAYWCRVSVGFIQMVVLKKCCKHYIQMGYFLQTPY